MPPRLISTVLALACISLCVFQLWSNCPFVLFLSVDTGWMLAIGKDILQTLAIPHADPYSWTNPSLPFVAYQWLYEVIIATLYKINGLWLVGLISFLLSGLLYLFLLPQIWIARGVPAFAPYLILSIAPATHWFSCRPGILSAYFLIATIFLVEQNRTAPSKRIWLIPCIFVLWANIHTFWSIGLLVLIVYLLCATIRKEKNSTTLLLVFLTSMLATVLNPYGTDLHVHLWTFLNGSQFREIQELVPLTSSSAAFPTGIFLALSWAVLLWQRKSIPLEGFIISAITTIMAISMVRFEFVAKISCWIYVGIGIAQIQWSKNFFHIPDLKKWKTAQFLAAMLASFLIWLNAFPSEQVAWNAFMDSSEPIIDFVSKHLAGDSSNRLFNESATGSWLIAKGYSGVFSDTRYDMYPKSFLNQQENFLQGKDVFDFIRAWNLNTILIRDSSTELYLQLLSAPDWNIVLDNRKYSLWLRNDREGMEKFAKWGVDDDHFNDAPLPYNLVESTYIARVGQYLKRSKTLREAGRYQEAFEAVEKAVSIMPDNDAVKSEYNLCLQSLQSTTKSNSNHN